MDSSSDPSGWPLLGPVSSDCQYCNEVRQVMANNAFADLLGNDFAVEAIIATTPAASVIPSVGALSAGHVLVVPNRHYLNLALTPRDELADLSNLATATYLALRATYNVTVVAFEHGSLHDRKSSGGCLDHAHLHLLPLPVDLMPRVVGFPALWRAVCSEESILNTAASLVSQGAGYLALWDGRAWWIRSGPARAQELRRSIAEAQGMPDYWDWALFPNIDLMCQTVVDLRGAIDTKRRYSTSLNFVPAWPVPG